MERCKNLSRQDFFEIHSVTVTPGDMEECKCRNISEGVCDVSSCLPEPLELIGVHQFGVSPSPTVQEIDHPHRYLEWSTPYSLTPRSKATYSGFLIRIK